MKTPPASFRPLAIALLALSGAIHAQMIVTPPGPRSVTVTPPPRAATTVTTPAGRRPPAASPPRRAIVVAAPPAAGSRASARIAGLRDSGIAAVTPALAGAHALSGFELRFDNGDHKLRRIGMLGKDQFVEFSLADSNGDDPFRAHAHYTLLEGGVAGSVSAYGGGKFEIPLPREHGVAAGSATLVLSGFEFRRADGSDANLRAIGVWLDPVRSIARVTLMDDQGADYRGFENTLGEAFVAGMLPFGILGGTTASIVDGANRLHRAGGPHRPYAVTVQYAWIPTAAVERRGSLAGTGEQRVQRPPSRIDALQGFEFLFTNSDHHLLGLGVNGARGGDVFFQDNNTRDPMQWSVSYLTMKQRAP